jgi:hypothetical protein
MWEPRSLKTLWTSTTCYRDSFLSCESLHKIQYARNRVQWRAYVNQWRARSFFPGLAILNICRKNLHLWASLILVFIFGFGRDWVKLTAIGSYPLVIWLAYSSRGELHKSIAFQLMNKQDRCKKCWHPDLHMNKQISSEILPALSNCVSNSSKNNHHQEK